MYHTSLFQLDKCNSVWHQSPGRVDAEQPFTAKRSQTEVLWYSSSPRISQPPIDQWQLCGNAVQARHSGP